jgi:hypothetical protein
MVSGVSRLDECGLDHVELSLKPTKLGMRGR